MSNNDNLQGGWSEWSKHVLLTLEKLERKVNKLEENIHQDKLDTQKELVVLNTKAGILGAIAGFLSAIAVSVIAGLILFNLTTEKVDNRIEDNQKNVTKNESVIIEDRKYFSFLTEYEDNEG